MEKIKRKKRYPVYKKTMSKFCIETYQQNLDWWIRCTNCGCEWQPGIKHGGGYHRKWWLCFNCGIQKQIINKGEII